MKMLCAALFLLVAMSLYGCGQYRKDCRAEDRCDDNTKGNLKEFGCNVVTDKASCQAACDVRAGASRYQGVWEENKMCSCSRGVPACLCQIDGKPASIALLEVVGEDSRSSAAIIAVGLLATVSLASFACHRFNTQVHVVARDGWPVLLA